MTLFGIGPIELLVILVLALIVFGPNKLPEIARSLGKALSELRRTSQEVTNTVMRELDVDSEPEKAPKPPPKIPQSVQDAVRKMVEARPQELSSGEPMAQEGEPTDDAQAPPPETVHSLDEV